MSHKTAIITGTNGYLGMAIARQLIDDVDPSTKLTIVVTSRTLKGVKSAVDELRAYVLKNHPKRPALVEFDYLLFDQTSKVSMLACAQEILTRYSHIDYLFFNSSQSQMAGIDYVQACKDVFTSPIKAFTVGTFKLQGVSKRSTDGLASVFQANVLSPWFLVNELIPLLKNGGRVIWISSSISLPEHFSLDDMGLDTSEKSYEASKYELELLHLGTYKQLLEQHGIESWLLHPGVFKSTTFVPTLNFISYLSMFLMFYICRWCGSPYHCIYPEIAANAPIWTALVADADKDDQSKKYGSGTDRWGNPKLLCEEVERTDENVQRLYEYVENIRLQWKDDLKDQIVPRNLY